MAALGIAMVTVSRHAVEPKILLKTQIRVLYQSRGVDYAKSRVWAAALKCRPPASTICCKHQSCAAVSNLNSRLARQRVLHR